MNNYIDVVVPKITPKKKTKVNKIKENIAITTVQKQAKTVNKVKQMQKMFTLTLDDMMRFDNIAVPIEYVVERLHIDAKKIRDNMASGYWNLGYIEENPIRNKYHIMSYKLIEQLGIVYPPCIRSEELK